MPVGSDPGNLKPRINISNRFIILSCLTQVTQCYVNNKNDTLKCARDVGVFLKCVDAHLYRAVRGANEESSKSNSKRASYADKFKRGY